MTTFTYEFDTLDGWTIWTAPNPPKDLVTPELNIEVSPPGHPLAVHNPPHSLRFRKHWSTWHAGVMRQFVVTPLSLVKLSAWGRIWNTSEGLFPSPSDTNTHPYLRVGIDNTGGTNPTSQSVTWNELKVYDEWKLVEVQQIALAGSVTVFAGFENGRTGQWDLQNMYAFLDTVTVDIEAGSEPPPQPPPTTDKPLWGIESFEDMGASWRIVARVPKVNG